MMRRMRLRQLVPRLRRAIEPRQRAQRLEVVAVDAIGGEPRVERVALATELLFPHATEVLVERNLLAVAGATAIWRSMISTSSSHLLAARREVGEGAERLRLLAADVEHATEQLDRLVLLVERVASRSAPCARRCRPSPRRRRRCRSASRRSRAAASSPRGGSGSLSIASSARRLRLSCSRTAV